MTLLYQRQK